MRLSIFLRNVFAKVPAIISTLSAIENSSIYDYMRNNTCKAVTSSLSFLVRTSFGACALFDSMAEAFYFI